MVEQRGHSGTRDQIIEMLKIKTSIYVSGLSHWVHANLLFWRPANVNGRWLAATAIYGRKKYR